MDMDHRKLFNVLVIGGAMLGASCVEEPPGSGEDAGREPIVDAATPLGDGGEPIADAGDPSTDAGSAPDAATPGADGGELTDCGLCPNEVCCETDASGESHTREGMMCCWGTSC